MEVVHKFLNSADTLLEGTTFFGISVTLPVYPSA